MSERSGTFFRRCAASAVALIAIGALAGCTRTQIHAVELSARSNSAASTPTPAAKGAAQQFIDAINGFRGANGLGPLTVQPTLEMKAALWAEWMAGGNCGRGSDGVPLICHSNLTSGITLSWTLLEENVGVANPPSNVAGLESGFEHSALHAANMLNPQITSIGVGVSFAYGRLYVAEEFMAQ